MLGNKWEKVERDQSEMGSMAKTIHSGTEDAYTVLEEMLLADYLSEERLLKYAEPVERLASLFDHISSTSTFRIMELLGIVLQCSISGPIDVLSSTSCHLEQIC